MLAQPFHDKFIKLIYLSENYKNNIIEAYNVNFITFYNTGARVFSKSYFGHRSSGTHIMSSVSCSNSAASLLDCSYNSVSAFASCGDLNRAGVICLGKYFILVTVRYIYMYNT